MVYTLNLCEYRLMLFDTRVPFGEQICGKEKQSATLLHAKTTSVRDEETGANAWIREL